MSTIEQILSKEVETNQTPSVQYYLFNRDRILKSYVAGFSNIGKQQKADPHTTYHAYSVTKTFTALAILQLAEKGVINIDKPVIQYLPDFPYGAEITTKQILNHSAGIPNPVPLNWIHLDTEKDSFDKNAFLKSVINNNRKVKAKPNDKFAYSNLGYVLLGQLIEKISGRTYEDYITENIIQKLPVNAGDLSFVFTDHISHATGYHKRMSFSNLILGFFIDKSKFMDKPEGKWRPFKTFYVNGQSYGGLIGKPISFVRYVQEILKDNSGLVSSECRKMLFQENKSNNGRNTGMCLSWFSGQLGGYNYYAHAGGGGGFYCEIRIYPGLNIGSVVFFNRTGMSDERYLDKLDKLYINEQNALR